MFYPYFKLAENMLNTQIIEKVWTETKNIQILIHFYANSDNL